MSFVSRLIEASLWAWQVPSATTSPDLWARLLGQLLAALIFSALGVFVLLASFLIMARLLPFSIIKEVEEDQNVALAIVIGSVVLGLSIIIAAAMLG